MRWFATSCGAVASDCAATSTSPRRRLSLDTYIYIYIYSIERDVCLSKYLSIFL